jgi:hypothetical protein
MADLSLSVILRKVVPSTLADTVEMAHVAISPGTLVGFRYQVTSEPGFLILLKATQR